MAIKTKERGVHNTWQQTKLISGETNKSRRWRDKHNNGINEISKRAAMKRLRVSNQANTTTKINDTAMGESGIAAGRNTCHH